MQACRACGATRGTGPGPCPHCGDEPTPSSVSGRAIRFDDVEPAALPPRRVNDLATPDPATLLRWDEVLAQSPVFEAVEPLPVLTPVGGGPSVHVDIEARFEMASAPADAEPLVHLLLTMTPTGTPLREATAGPVAHVILALDLSASMNHPDKYPLLTEALTGMLYDLRAPQAADVLLSVVVYAWGAETLFRDVPASTLEPRQVLDAVDRSPLRFGRYTDVVGALKRAGAIARDSVQTHKAMPVRICLLTDGRPQDMEGAQKVMQIVSRMPVDVDGLAFGADADVAALQQLVSGGRGGTVKQVRPETIGDAFGRIAEVAQRVVARRALLDVELRAGVVGGAAYRFRPARHRYGDDAFAGGSNFSVDLGTLETGRPYSLLFQLRLPEARAGQAETEIGRVALRVPGLGGPRLFEKLLSIPRHPGTAPIDVDEEVLAARDVVEAMVRDDPEATLRALRVRRRLYEAERRDPHLLGVIDKAISELEERGNLAALSAAEHAALMSHTCTAGSSGRALRSRREMPIR